MTVSFIKRVMASEYISFALRVYLGYFFIYANSDGTASYSVRRNDVYQHVRERPDHLMYESAPITCGCYDEVGTARSLGLTSMRERAELTGGKFMIESTPGEGTTIRVSWQLKLRINFKTAV